MKAVRRRGPSNGLAFPDLPLVAGSNVDNNKLSRTRSSSSASASSRNSSKSSSSRSTTSSISVRLSRLSQFSRGVRAHLVEVVFYSVHFVLFYFVLVPSIGQSVREKCEAYHYCNSFVKKQTWLPGLTYSVDLADGQWRDLRGALGLLWASMLGITSAHYLLRGAWRLSDAVGAQRGDATASAWFRMLVGLVFLAVQHGYQSLVVLLIAYVGYRLAVWQREARLRHSAITWLYALTVLLFKESYRLQHWEGLHFLRPVFDQRRFGGLYGWQLPANFLVLRIISFSVDFQWAARQHDDEEEKSPQSDDSPPASPPTSLRDDLSPPASPRSTLSRSSLSPGREAGQSLLPLSSSSSTAAAAANPPSSSSSSTAAESTHRPLEQYNFVNYLSYMLYAPLYTAGPVITFNDFVENTHHPQRAEDPVMYGLRWLLCLALMELLTSLFPFFAVIKSGLFPYLSCGELAVVAYMTLKMMWLKFLLVWRFFRLWALADGTLAPENMQRCMSNNCSLEQFWRGWHSSFNRWIVRYMYLPLGGRTARLWAVWPIFLFVAVWHDIEMKLLVWGLLNAFFYVVEVLAKRLAASPAMRGLPSSVFRLVCILSGATYILVLVGVNLVGYAVGVGGVALMLSKLHSWEGLWVVFCCYYLCSVAIGFMSFLQRMGLSKP